MKSRSARARWSGLALAAVWLTLAPSVANGSKAQPAVTRGALVERVVAVVDGKPILLSQVKRRAAPFVATMRAHLGGAPDVAEERKIYQQVLDGLLNERLLLLHAAKVDVRAWPREIDTAIARVAQQGGKSVDELLEDVRSTTGMDEEQYRGEIARQILEYKVLSRLVPVLPKSGDKRATLSLLEQKKRELFAKLRQDVAVVVKVRFQ